ncbi:MAG: hypothetical protein ACRYE9_02735 [Janthinobacterium lividum]
MLVKTIILILGLFYQYVSYANPAPLDLELNKATLQDITRTHKILSKELTTYGEI